MATLCKSKYGAWWRAEAWISMFVCLVLEHDDAESQDSKEEA